MVCPVWFNEEWRQFVKQFPSVVPRMAQLLFFSRKPLFMSIERYVYAFFRL
jgi:hypothetical protein